MVVPLFVGREKSVRALEEVMRGDKQILLATQKNSADDDPAPDAIYDVGVVATVLQLLKLPDGTVKVLVEGKQRAAVTRFIGSEDFYEAEAAILDEDDGEEHEAEALSRAVAEQFEAYVKLNKKIPPEALASIPHITEPGKLADSIAAHLSVKIGDKQQLLELFNVVKRLEKVFSLMEGEISVLQVEKKIRSRVKRQMEKTQREYYLNEQMKAIQRELGDADEEKDPIAARSGGPKRDEFEHSFLGVETGVEECDPASHQGGEGLMPIGGGRGFVVGDGCEHAIGRDADGLGETEATDVVGFRRTGGVPTGDSGEGPGMNTAGGDRFLPTVV
eukprot:gene14380-14174_t